MQVLLLSCVQLPSAVAACAIAFLQPCVRVFFAGVATSFVALGVILVVVACAVAYACNAVFGCCICNC